MHQSPERRVSFSLTILGSRPPLLFFSAAAFFLLFDELFFSSVPVAPAASSSSPTENWARKTVALYLPEHRAWEWPKQFRFPQVSLAPQRRQPDGKDQASRCSDLRAMWIDDLPLAWSQVLGLLLNREEEAAVKSVLKRPSGCYLLVRLSSFFSYLSSLVFVDLSRRIARRFPSDTRIDDGLTRLEQCLL